MPSESGLPHLGDMITDAPLTNFNVQPMRISYNVKGLKHICHTSGFFTLWTSHFVTHANLCVTLKSKIIKMKDSQSFAVGFP